MSDSAPGIPGVVFHASEDAFIWYFPSGSLNPLLSELKQGIMM